MDEGAREVDGGVERAHQAGEALQAIRRVAEGVSGQTQSIVSVSQQMRGDADALTLNMDTVSARVEENTAATEMMITGVNDVSQSVDAIASVSEQNSAAVEQVSAATEEMSAQVAQVTASAEAL